MGKHGPCYHCGVTSTPLWRNGPPDKPVLCNACGSRWRTKGTLANYTPLHKREAPELEMPKRPKESTHLKLKLKNLQKAQWSNKIPETESGIGDYGHIFAKGVDEDTSNRSSSGSAVSFSESCANFSGADVSEVTGSLQTNAWETLVPSRKRTGMVRPRHSSVEKLTKDLHSILNEQSSYLTASSEDLLYESNTSTGLIEIGNGSVLLRHPSSTSVEEESEASSLPLRNKSTCAELLLMTDCQSKASNVSDMCNMKIRGSSSQEQLKRDKASQEKIHILRNKESQLGSIDLHDIICLDGYMKYLTNEEQQHLTRYLPSVDTRNPPESLKSMFTCSQMAQSFSSFQHLLQEGIFDLSTSEINSDDCKNLRKLVLSNLMKAAWVESYKTLKDARHNPKDSKKGGQGGTTFLGHSSTSLKRPHESYNDNFEEPKVMKCIKKSCSKAVHPSLPSMKSIEQNPGGLAKKPKIDSCSHIKSKCSSDSPMTPPALSSRKGCIFNSMQLTDSNPDEDLLVDVRSTTSFPEAQLLSDAWLQNVPSKSSCGENRASGKEDSLLCHSAVSFTSDLPKQR